MDNTFHVNNTTYGLVVTFEKKELNALIHKDKMFVVFHMFF